MKRAWARAKEDERRQFLEFVEKEREGEEPKRRTGKKAEGKPQRPK